MDTSLYAIKNEKLIPQFDLEHIRRRADDGFAVNEAGNIIALRLMKTNVETLFLSSDALDLEYLYISGNQNIKQLKFVIGLPKLKLLYADNIGITDIEFPIGFDALQQIYLQNNPALTKVVFNGDCPQLILMDLVDNAQLTELTIKKVFSKMEYLYLKGSALQNIPKDITEANTNCWEDVRNYLSAGKLEEFVHLHEAKMILIGNGEVGKSSIRIKLLDKKGKLPTKLDRTPGLHSVIENYPIIISNNNGSQAETIDFKLKIWDFGGQGKFREVQSLFCSRKSLYVYVTSPDNNNPENENYIGDDYWLLMANAYRTEQTENESTPIIYVMNKIDLPGDTSIQEKDIKDVYGNVEFIKISCETLENFPRFETKITESVSKIGPDVLLDKYSGNWLTVKKILEDKAAEGINHISKQAYLDICAENKMDVSAAETTWLTVLDRIGTVLYFSKKFSDEALKGFIVLNPNWVRDAICKVLAATDTIIVDAKFYPKQFSTVWATYKVAEKEFAYTADEHKKLLAFLLAYEMCYPQKKSGETFYVFPALIEKKKPEDTIEFSATDYHLRFVYKPFLPAGTLNKLIVGLYQKIYNDQIWKNGVVLHDHKTNTYAELTENWQEKYIELKLKGSEVADMYHIIVEKLNSLIDDLKDAKLLRYLEFSVEAFHKGNFIGSSVLKNFGVKEFAFLWDENLRGIRLKDEFKEILKLGTQEIKMEKFREFMPFAKVKSKVKILFLASGTLNTGLESRYAEDIIQFFDKDRRLKFIQKHGLDREKFRQFVLTEDSDILHYAGHGTKKGIILEQRNLEAEDFSRIVALSDKTQCVVLNACNTFSIAKLLAQHIPFVIGTQAPVNDSTAIAFAQGFYLGIASGKTIEKSFDFGIEEIKDKNLPDENVFVLFKGVKEKA